MTGLQIAALALYQHINTVGAFCYLPVLPVRSSSDSRPPFTNGKYQLNNQLPKVYTITLILSVSLPQAQQAHQASHHLLSLPTILTPPMAPTPLHRRLSSAPRTPIDPLATFSGFDFEKSPGERKRKTRSYEPASLVQVWRRSSERVGGYRRRSSVGLEVDVSLPHDGAECEGIGRNGSSTIRAVFDLSAVAGQAAIVLGSVCVVSTAIP